VDDTVDRSTITSYPLVNGPMVFTNDDVSDYNPIGQKCACPCHTTPGFWGKNLKEASMHCCGTLHQKEPIK